MIDEIYTIEEIQQIGEFLAVYEALTHHQRDFHVSLANIRWLFGGNQSGKSWANMIDLVMVILGIHPTRKTPKNAIYWVATESFELLREVIWERYLDLFIPKHRIKHIDWGKDHTPRKLYIDNGVTVVFKAFSQGRKKFQAAQIDGFYGDEQCLSDFTGILQEIQMRVLKRNGFISWSMTPIIPQMSLEDRISDLPDTDETFFLDLNDNRISEGGYIEDERIDELIEEWPEETRVTRIEGKFSSYFGSVYQTFNRATHMADPISEPNPDWELYRGFDWGWNSPFVCLWLGKDKENCWHIYREYVARRTPINELADAVIQLSGNEEYRCNIADTESPRERDDFRKKGIPTISAKKDILPGIECVQGRLKVRRGKPSLYVGKDCPHTLKEFAVYRNSDDRRINLPIKENDHCMDVIRYILFTMLKPRKKGKVLFTV